MANGSGAPASQLRPTTCTGRRTRHSSPCDFWMRSGPNYDARLPWPRVRRASAARVPGHQLQRGKKRNLRRLNFRHARPGRTNAHAAGALASTPIAIASSTRHPFSLLRLPVTSPSLLHLPALVSRPPPLLSLLIHAGPRGVCRWSCELCGCVASAAIPATLGV